MEESILFHRSRETFILVVGPHREVKLEEVYPRMNSEESFV
jgi:hypothetical protein